MKERWGDGRENTAASPLPGTSEPPASRYDVALLDLDGVVYLGGHPIAGAAEALDKADAAGMRLAFVTNNASRTPSAVAAQLTGLGVRRQRRGRDHLGAGGGPAAGRAPAAGGAGPGGGRHRAAGRGPGAGAAPGVGRERAPGRGGPGVHARPQLRTAGRGRARGRRRGLVRRLERGRHAAHAARAPARQRVPDPGDRHRDRPVSGRGRQARAPAPRRGRGPQRRAATRSSSGTGSTPTSRAPSGPAPTACWC